MVYGLLLPTDPDLSHHHHHCDSVLALIFNSRSQHSQYSRIVYISYNIKGGYRSHDGMIDSISSNEALLLRNLMLLTSRRARRITHIGKIFESYMYPLAKSQMLSVTLAPPVNGHEDDCFSLLRRDDRCSWS